MPASLLLLRGSPARYFSAPGRTEIGGNHTDHQRGRVLAAAVNLDTVAAVRVNGTNIIRIQSKGYPMSVVDLDNLTPVESEINSTPAQILPRLRLLEEEDPQLRLQYRGGSDPCAYHG